MPLQFRCPHCSQRMRLALKADDSVTSVACPTCARSFTVRTKSGDLSADILGAFAELDSPHLENAIQRDEDVSADPNQTGGSGQNPVATAATMIRAMPKKRRIEIGVVAVIAFAFLVMIGGFLASGGATLPPMTDTQPKLRKVKIPAYKDRSMGQERGVTD